MIIPEWLFKEEQTPIKNKIKKVYNPKTLKQIARENIKMNDKGLDKELVKKILIHIILLMNFYKSASKLINKVIIVIMQILS